VRVFNIDQRSIFRGEKITPSVPGVRRAVGTRLIQLVLPNASLDLTERPAAYPTSAHPEGRN